LNFQILQLLTGDELQRIVSGLSTQAFSDGKLTATGLARKVKNNLQAGRSGPEPTALDEIVLAALQRNEDFQKFTIPKRIVLPTFARYTPGMEYGSHVDSAVMGWNGEPLRTDLAATVFLNEPDT
jgi:PKHD-type hydroxylase